MANKPLTQDQLAKVEEKIKTFMANKQSWVKRYGKDAESVMRGRAISNVKKQTQQMNKQKLKELVRKTLMKEQDIEVGADRYEEEQDVTMASNLLDTLESLLKKHDWYYEMSDDDRKYRQGTNEEREIKKRMSELSIMGYGEDAKALFNRYNPYNKTKINEYYGDDEDFEGTGLLVKGRTNIDNRKIADYIDDSNDDAGVWNAKEGYWFFPEGEEMIDELEYILKDTFEKRKIKASFEAKLDESTNESFPDLTGDGKVTKADILKGRGVELDEDLDLGHTDNEPHMLKGDLYRIGKYAMELYQMVDQFEGQGEVDFPHWWQAKIIKAKEMIVAAKHYLDFETKEPAIDTMMDTVEDEGTFDNVGVEQPMFEEMSENLKDLFEINVWKIQRVIDGFKITSAKRIPSIPPDIKSKVKPVVNGWMPDFNGYDGAKLFKVPNTSKKYLTVGEKTSGGIKSYWFEVNSNFQEPSLTKTMEENKTKKVKKLAETIVKNLKESSYKTSPNSVEARSLKKGDILTSGDTVVSISSGAKTPSGKVEVTLEKNGKTKTSVWGKYTKVGVKKP